MQLRSSFIHSRASFNLFVVTALLGMLFALPGISTIAAPALNQTGNDLPPAGNVIVVMKEGTFTASSVEVASEAGVEPDLTFSSAFTGFSASVNQTQLNQLAADPNVDFIAEDVPMYAAAQTPSTAISRSALTGYSQVNGGGPNADVDIAILDTGIDSTHPDLNVAGVLQNCSDAPTAEDTDGHGTHVAGIAAAIDNGQGVVGAAPGARLWNAKVLRNSGVGQMSWVVCGIDAAIAKGGIEVINMSIAGASSGNVGTCAGTSDPLYKAVCRASSAGILMVVAAGNSGRDAGTTIPALYPEVVTVANVGDTDGQPGNDSLNSTSNYGPVVDIAAPGTNILSSVLGGAYGYKTGTSMASPLVAGAAAMYMAYTGNGAGATRNWLMSTASQPQSSSVGWSPAAPSGSPNRILYLGNVPPGTVDYPSGTANPSFAGAPATVILSNATMNSAATIKTRDGDPASNWTSASLPDGTVILTIDLGRQRDISGVKWMTAFNGFADKFTVRLMNESYQSFTLGTFGNPGQSRTWYGVAPGSPVRARWVKFYIDNPNGDYVVGSFSEFETWAVDTGNNPPPPGTPRPGFEGSKATIIDSSATMNSWQAFRTYDGDSLTNWTSGSQPDGTVILTLDLGVDRDLSGIKWMTTFIGYADEFTVRTMDSAYRSHTIGTFGNPTESRVFHGVAIPASNQVNARWVKFYFENPNFDPLVGSIGEVEIWARGGAASAAGTGVVEPAFSGEKLPIQSSTATDAAWATAKTYDGDAATNWATSHSSPETATLTYDLGSDVTISGVKWQTAFNGYADAYTVQMRSANGSPTTLGEFGNPPASRLWYGVASSGVTARYVDFIFTNPNRDSALGSIGEVEIWGTPAATFSSLGLSDPVLAGAPLPLTCAAIPVNADGSHDGSQACDGNGGTNWHTDATSPATAVLTIDLTAPTALSGVKWNFAEAGHAEQFEVTVVTDGVSRSMGTFSGGAAGAYEGVAFPAGIVGEQVILSFTNVDADADLGYLAEVEVWGEPAGAATPAASPEASPAASPAASPEAPMAEEPESSPIAEEPVASPIVEEPVASPIADEPVTSDKAPAASPEPGEVTATTEPTSTTEPTATVESTATIEPTATTEPTATVEPTAAISIGTITGTDGDRVNCRQNPVNGAVIASLNEGEVVDVLGPVQDGWYPVSCAGQDGYVAADFVTLGTPVADTASPTATMAGDVPTEPTATTALTVDPTATPEPTATTEPTETPYPIVDTGDTEQSQQAIYASDDDSGTWWSVSPSLAPEQTRLYLDLGAVLPIDHLTLNLATWDQLPYFEIWLSEDAETWYNATPQGIDGWSLEREVDLVIDLGYDARYVRLVIPHVDESGLGEVGGIRQLDVWAGDITETQDLTALGNPTTPTPEPVVEDEVLPTEAPTEEVLPTEEPTDEIIPTVEPTVAGDPGQELPPADGADDGGQEGEPIDLNG